VVFNAELPLMMKKAKSVKKNKKSLNYKKSNSKKIIILEHKKRFEEIKENKQSPIDFEDEEDEDFEFSPGFRLNSTTKRNLENLPIGNSLESELTFAPRIREKGKEGKNYSETKYEVNYNGGKYGEKTPDEYAGVEPVAKPSEDSSNQ
jgi:hypothetical protein